MKEQRIGNMIYTLAAISTVKGFYYDILLNIHDYIQNKNGKIKTLKRMFTNAAKVYLNLPKHNSYMIWTNFLMLLLWGYRGFVASGMNSSPSDNTHLFRVYTNSSNQSWQKDWPRYCIRKTELTVRVEE